MRTLSTQVRLRRLIRAYGEAWERLESEPIELTKAESFVARLLELAELVRGAWELESRAGHVAQPLQGYVRDALRTTELAIAGLQQSGADLKLLRQDFESAALPLEFFLRGLDSEPAALQRTA
jgi:hypothetical protein